MSPSTKDLQVPFLILSFFTLTSLTITQTPPRAMVTGRSGVVETTLGPVQGLRKTFNGRDVDVYYGIPFARPPVGELRFKRPVPATSWSETRNVSRMPNSCHQSIDVAFNRSKGVDMWNPNTEMSEDCLYLNAWVPRGFGAQGPRTTMVWIYGGGFWAGTSTLTVYDSTKLAATENVIVFSMNYRMGALGFLYTNTSGAPGNVGLLDQSLALKWIYENVEQFGGSKDSITIFGESAGAASVGFHLLSPQSQDYFTRAIMQSSSPLVNWGVTTNAKALRRSQDLAELVGCSVGSVNTMLDCLRGKDPQNLTDTMWSVAEYYFDVPIAPVVDGFFFPDHPKKLFASGRIKDTEVIAGANKDEGLFFLLYAFANEFPIDNTGEISYSRFKEMVHDMNFQADEKIDQAVLYKYLHSKLPPNGHSYRDIADEISGDDLFKCPVVDFATEYARTGHDVYLYSFEHRLSNNPWPEWTGVMHGYEVEAVFMLPEDTSYTAQDLAVASRMAAYWTRFAQSGDPNGQLTRWPKLTSETLEYLTISGDGDSIRQGLRHEECGFRRIILPLLKQEQTRPSEIACHTIPTGGHEPMGYSLLALLLTTMASFYFLLMT